MAKYIIEVKNNPEFCGIGAGGVQFANGKATIESERLANWFKEHPGYTVTKEGEAPKALKSMKADELKALAAEKGIDISEAKNKDEIIAIIEANQ